MEQFYYLYGIIKNKIKLNNTGFEQKKPILIKFQKIFAITSKVSEKNFSQQQINKNISSMQWLEKNAQIHEKIIENAMQKTTILPFKFCTIFKTQQQIKQMLKQHETEFLQILEELKEKIEIGIKIYYEPEKFSQQIIAQSKQASQLKQEMQKQSKGKAYFTQQKINEIIKTELEQKTKNIANNAFNTLTQKAIQAKANPLIKTKTSKKMCLNAVFLIEKNKHQEFIKTAKNLEQENIETSISKAFPPYNFVNISVI